ncbi:hypothetical protein [Marimonas arenosa]|uniref:Uncharacterized protein n=1 Tax=Marimonas arenosa TaxID=1795305 RepID=A0AAE3WEB5_9RHOB|nr:hypothetical protein [Marimonas arenosa]MDQ2090923.1 hypothetical protein [Marimonas arenosa]
MTRPWHVQGWRAGMARLGRGVRRPVAACAMALVLTGCLSETDGTLGLLSASATGPAGAASGATRPAKPPLRQAELVRGKVAVVAPRGYCLVRRTLRRGVTGGFALIASCNSLTGSFGSADVDPVVMTVQVQPGLLTRTLPSADGLATAMQPARALHKIDGDGMTLVHLDSGGDRGLPAGDPRHWRGALMVNGYLVGLALYAPKGSAQAGPRGRRLIHRLAENILDTSPIADFSTAGKPVAPVPD